MKDAEERARHLFEAQGDFVVRRTADGTISFANDAYCLLAGRPREQLLGSDFQLDPVEQGSVAMETDGTRVHDQRIESNLGPRWIAWRESMIRLDAQFSRRSCNASAAM